MRGSFGVAAALAVVLIGSAQPALAQCSDGTPTRADGSCGTSRTVRAIDPNRVAIFPFRATGVDPSQRELGAGLAELLAAEFNGETGPTAVEPVEADRAWVRAGGDKSALTRPMALRTAGQLGAGRLIEGSIVRTGTTFTITASMLRVPDGVIQGAPVKVQLTEDGLGTAASAVATQILGTTVGITASVPAEAQRAYLTGMVLYRKNAAGADSMFLRALGIDSTFIHPAFRMVVQNALMGPQVLGIDRYGPSFRILWNRRQQLSREQQVLLEAVADSGGLRLRPAALQRMERAIPALQGSAEAWEILANGYYTVGALLGREDWLERAKRAYRNVIQLDPSLRARSNKHLAEFAIYEGDVRALATYSSGTPWERYATALLKRDPAAIRGARVAYALDVSGTYLVSGIFPYWLTGTYLPPGEADSLLQQVERLAISEVQRRNFGGWSHDVALHSGRPARAAELARSYPGVMLEVIDVVAIDSTARETRFARANRENPGYSDAACEAGLSRTRRGDTTGVSAILTEIELASLTVSEIFQREPKGGNGLRALCPYVLRGALASLRSSPDDSAVLLADSLMRALWFYLGDAYNYDVAVAFARRGDYAKAASAVRRQPRWFTPGGRVPRRVASLRLEGRWAALAGDTVRALKAYDDYLKWRSDPEPVLVPQRDSVRAERAAILAKRRAPAKPAPRKP